MEGGPFDDTLEIKTAKGRRVWVRALGEVIRKENVIVAVEGAFQDLTDLIAIRDEAARLSERLRRNLEGIIDGFVQLDQDRCYSFINAQVERIIGRSRDELLGKNIWEEFPEAVGSTFRREFERAVIENQPVRFEEYYPPFRFWVEVCADPTPAGLAVYFRDVTRVRGQQDQLRILETAISRQNVWTLVTNWISHFQ